MRQEAGAKDGCNPEERPPVGPRVVVRGGTQKREGGTEARDEVANEPDPPQPTAEADEYRGDGGDRSPSGQSQTERPDDEAEHGSEQRARQEVGADQIDAGDGRRDRAIEVGEPVVRQRL